MGKLFPAILLVLLGPLLFAENNKLVFAYSDVESFPNALGNGMKVANPAGISVEIIVQAAAELGFNVEFVRFPNKRVLEELRSGRADGAFLYSFREDRLAAGQYPMKSGEPDSSMRLTSQAYYVYCCKDSPVTWDGKKFDNLRRAVGANAGYSVVDDLKKMGIQVEEAKTTEQNLTKLVLGRIDAYVTENTFMVDHYLKTGKFNGIVKFERPFASKDYFLIFSHQLIRDNPETAGKFWLKIGEIRDRVTEEVRPKYIDYLGKNLSE